MIRMARFAACLAGWLAALLAGCSADPETGPAAGVPKDAGKDVDPDAVVPGCAAWELALENGGCQPAGIPEEACGKGFVSDGRRGCDPVLPKAACPTGQMAIPGEETC